MSSEARRLRRATSPADPNHQRLAQDRPREEAQKSYHTVLEQHVQQAQEDIERPATGLFLSSSSAGLDLGFGRCSWRLLPPRPMASFPGS